nr:PTS glucose transporter subunit IIA [Paenibacillus sp. PvR133]
MTGIVVRLQDIKDETFAGEHMGKGIASAPRMDVSYSQ